MLGVPVRERCHTTARQETPTRTKLSVCKATRCNRREPAHAAALQQQPLVNDPRIDRTELRPTTALHCTALQPATSAHTAEMRLSSATLAPAAAQVRQTQRAGLPRVRRIKTLARACSSSAARRARRTHLAPAAWCGRALTTGGGRLQEAGRIERPTKHPGRAAAKLARLPRPLAHTEHTAPGDLLSRRLTCSDSSLASQQQPTANGKTNQKWYSNSSHF